MNFSSKTLVKSQKMQIWLQIHKKFDPIFTPTFLQFATDSIYGQYAFF